MINQIEYNSKDLPENLKKQILDFLRKTWPDGFAGKNSTRDWISRDSNHPYNIMLVEDDIIVAHTEILWKNLNHEGVTYKAYGLSGVFTSVNFRRKGYGLQIVKAGTDYIKKQDVDIGIFHCDPKLKNFYSKAGWIAMEKAPATLIGHKENPQESNELMMMLFLSEKGKKGRESFESKPLYFGDATW